MEYKNLMGVILSGRNMMQAYGRVLRNGGAAGLDGMGVKQRGYRSFKDYYHHVRPKTNAP